MPPRRRRHWHKLALVLVIILGALVYYFWAPVQQAVCVASLQDAVTPRDSLTLGTGWYPKKPPPWLDEKVTPALDWYFSAARGYTQKDRDLQQERFHSLFENPIESIDIKSPSVFRGDAGAALPWFPRLLRVRIDDPKRQMSETDWQRIFHGLSRSPSVRELMIAGEGITDAALSHLANQRTLEVVTISHSSLTPECAATLATLPRLKTLVLGAPRRRQGKNSLSFKEKDAITAKLPNVELVFPQAYYAMP